MPEALRILRDELPNIDVMISSQYSPRLADGLSKGKIDAAFLRREKGVPGLAFRLLVKEPLIVILPSDHRLAALKAISPRDRGRDIRDSVGHGSGTTCGHRRLPEALQNQYHASSRGGPRHHGNFLNSVDTRRRAVTCLRTELSPFVCNESPSEGRYANCRSGPRLQKVEPVSHPKAFAFEIGRFGRSCLEQDPLKLGMHLGKRDYGVLESGAGSVRRAQIGFDPVYRARDRIHGASLHRLAMHVFAGKTSFKIIPPWWAACTNRE